MAATPSTTALGTAYENATKLFLSRPPFSIRGLLNVGGAGDGGVDLRGRWTWTAGAAAATSRPGASSDTTSPCTPRGGLLDLPGGARPTLLPPLGQSEDDQQLRTRTWDVLVQCKAEKDRLGPSIVRELEGSILADLARRNRPSLSSRSLAPPSPGAAAGSAPIGVLVGLSGFSEAAIRHAQTSAIPLVLAHLRVTDLREMVATRGREGDVSLVSASVNKAMKRLVEDAFAEQPVKAAQA
ncbi:hypothetical protein JCM10908_001814 [Rhodotorula pacifica]|uniref:uncharacterized protein n=1 Tax=Rhodotorula pacifica TaxID=1495444 RepID=UPI00317C9902